MTEQSDDLLKGLFTQIGCIMEDASVIALIWDDADSISFKDRYQQLTQAQRQIDAALAKIRLAVEGV